MSASQPELDAIDLQLLERLQTDASLSNQAMAKLVHVSPPTCLRRVKRLHEAGLIEREIAVLSVDTLASVIGHNLCAVVEITLDRQDQAALEAFEKKVLIEDAVQQCYRVSPGPDFCLVVHARDMPDYLALTQRLFTVDANVRNVKTFFSVKRSKFGARVPLPVSV
ncbi:Lrp/AsnC family transcriptional regulator [Rhodoferax sp.]|uniref:Lrp/AsnC family transcriptional regulator n=1 Tax=Rhodoferax sp. TaxID=50421 RepID=UPI00260E175A|nr:Lrp/AsnC family transcriptional regulator [Rhodoferax sp.]MDD2918956.1 Lrp/AsnC family transcriptional regulator [Rhodoferax sp.]